MVFKSFMAVQPTYMHTKSFIEECEFILFLQVTCSSIFYFRSVLYTCKISSCITDYILIAKDPTYLEIFLTTLVYCKLTLYDHSLIL